MVRKKSSCALSCDTSWRERCETSCLVGNLTSSGLQWWEFSKIHGAHCRSWVWTSEIIRSLVLGVTCLCGFFLLFFFLYAIIYVFVCVCVCVCVCVWCEIVSFLSREKVVSRRPGRLLFCLLWIDESKTKDKTYIWVSVWLGRLQTKRFTRLSHTGLVVELKHLKIKTRLTNEKFASVKGECEILSVKPLGLPISRREATYWLILTYSWCLQLINLFDLSWQ